jgi:hypothetical protein
MACAAGSRQNFLSGGRKSTEIQNGGLTPTEIRRPRWLCACRSGIVFLLLWAGMLAASEACGQTTDTPAADSATEPEPEFLKTLPRPPDQPASLFAPAPPLAPPPPNLEGPYFQQDPLLDPPALGAVGWFANVDIGILKPHLVNEEHLPVTFPDGTSFTVGVNPAHLNWTVSPRVEVGYRLPAGFGGIAVSYRNMTSQGSQGVIGADGPATLSSLLNVNVVDLDWVSHEYAWVRGWELRIRFGLRYLNDYWSSQADEPFAEAAAGSTIYHQRTTNSNWVIGPHGAVDLRRQLDFWGLAILGFVDFSEGWGRTRQTYSALSTTSAFGIPQGGGASQGTSDAVPVITARLGLSWQPPSFPNIHLFVGGQLDYWWNTGRMGNITTLGYFFDSGLLLRGEWNY